MTERRLNAKIERTRLMVSQFIDPKKRSKFGQFFTPAGIADFMAGLFDTHYYDECRLLDPGAGIGSLSAAFLDRFLESEGSLHNVEVTAIEIDPGLIPHLAETFSAYSRYSHMTVNVQQADFIELAADLLSNSIFSRSCSPYTHAILNPPYKKIKSTSHHRLFLREAGIETVNLYSAFVSLSLLLLADHGQLVAIIPRSFCNGPYYRSFREHIMSRSTIRRIHLFESRNKAFKDDDVLQENIIIKLEKGAIQGDVEISTSTDDSFSDLTIYECPFNRIVLPDDPERFIHIPVSPESSMIELPDAFRHSLQDIGVEVSTGPVVDFRMKQHLRKSPVSGSVPLLYPGHFNGNGLEWPKCGFKKCNAIMLNSETERWLYPKGSYCLVRRFSSKEEARRLIAMVVDSSDFPDTNLLGFENHLNLFHQRKQGLPLDLAHGLAVYLNSTTIDTHFRRFNGHTQVNATDLRLMRYPSRNVLMSLGTWAIRTKDLTQQVIDQKIENLSR